MAIPINIEELLRQQVIESTRLESRTDFAFYYSFR